MNKRCPMFVDLSAIFVRQASLASSLEIDRQIRFVPDAGELTKKRCAPVCLRSRECSHLRTSAERLVSSVVRQFCQLSVGSCISSVRPSRSSRIAIAVLAPS